VIIFQKSHISGITTAASLWVTAAIGACVGYGLYSIAIFTSLLIIIILTLFWKLENKLLHKESEQDNNESQ
jgi:putative Mg2+ transporter-C (MgtC) family protein